MRLTVPLSLCLLASGCAAHTAYLAEQSGQAALNEADEVDKAEARTLEERRERQIRRDQEAFETDIRAAEARRYVEAEESKLADEAEVLRQRISQTASAFLRQLDARGASDDGDPPVVILHVRVEASDDGSELTVAFAPMTTRAIASMNLEVDVFDRAGKHIRCKRERQVSCDHGQARLDFEHIKKVELDSGHVKLTLHGFKGATTARARVGRMRFVNRTSWQGRPEWHGDRHGEKHGEHEVEAAERIADWWARLKDAVLAAVAVQLSQPRTEVELTWDALCGDLRNGRSAEYDPRLGLFCQRSSDGR
jgi:hypothetical protein